MIRKLAFVFAAVLFVSCGDIPKSAADVSLNDQIKAAEALVERVTSGRQSEFVVNIIPSQ